MQEFSYNLEFEPDEYNVANQAGEGDNDAVYKNPFKHFTGIDTGVDALKIINKCDEKFDDRDGEMAPINEVDTAVYKSLLGNFKESRLGNLLPEIDSILDNSQGNRAREFWHEDMKGVFHESRYWLMEKVMRCYGSDFIEENWDTVTDALNSVMHRALNDWYQRIYKLPPLEDIADDRHYKEILAAEREALLAVYCEKIKTDPFFVEALDLITPDTAIDAINGNIVKIDLQNEGFVDQKEIVTTPEKIKSVMGVSVMPSDYIEADKDEAQEDGYQSSWQRLKEENLAIANGAILDVLMNTLKKHLGALDSRVKNKERSGLEESFREPIKKYLHKLYNFKYSTLYTNPLRSFSRVLETEMSELSSEIEKKVMKLNKRIKKRAKRRGRKLDGRRMPSERLSINNEAELSFAEDVQGSEAYTGARNLGRVVSTREMYDARKLDRNKRDNSADVKAGHRPRYKDHRRNAAEQMGEYFAPVEAVERVDDQGDCAQTCEQTIAQTKVQIDKITKSVEATQVPAGVEAAMAKEMEAYNAYMQALAEFDVAVAEGKDEHEVRGKKISVVIKNSEYVIARSKRVVAEINS